MNVDIAENIEIAKTQTAAAYAENLNHTKNSYYGLVRNLITLATVMLSLAAAFADKLQKPSPNFLWLLQACLGFLATTILSGLFASFGEVRGHELFGQALIQKYNDLIASDLGRQIKATRTVYSATNSKYFSYAFQIEIFSFSLATLVLAIFAIVNF